MSLVLANNLLSQIDDLDALRECPVCYERMSERISLCSQGHAVCKKCLLKILRCPLCNSTFNGARDFLAEGIIAKLEEIKSAITNLALESSVNYAEKIKAEGPEVEVEKFPCAIRYCENAQLSYRDMVAHINTAHQSILIFKEDHSESYRNWWIIYHICFTVWSRIIYIKNMGIFFVNVSIGTKGQVCGYVANVNLLDNRKYYYRLRIYHPYKDLFFSGEVESTKNSRKKDKYKYIGEAVYRNDYGKYCFDCHLRIICA